MAKFHVHMTFAAPTQRDPRPRQTARLRHGGMAGYLASDGTIAATARVRAESAADAARLLCEAVEREESMHGRGPVWPLSWTATRSVPVFAGLGRRRRWGWSGGAGDDWGDDDGGTAGVREPRRPRPSPGALSATLEPPRETWGRFPL